MLVRVSFAAGEVGDMHTHPHEQITYVLSGQVEFTVEDTQVVLNAGDHLVMPSNARHGCRALVPSVLLDVFSPIREDFIAG